MSGIEKKPRLEHMLSFPWSFVPDLHPHYVALPPGKRAESLRARMWILNKSRF